MSDIVSFKIFGLDQLQKKLQEELPKDARLALRIALAAGGGTVKAAMVAEAPVEEGGGPDAGFLCDHIRVKTILGRGDLSGKALVGATRDVYPTHPGKRGKVEFRTVTGKLVSFFSKTAGQVTASRVARWLEFGTSKMGPHPWMTKAWETSKAASLERIISKLKEQLHLS